MAVASGHSFPLVSRYDKPISTMKEWRDERRAVNAGWVPGKSAWEIANAWVGSGKPLVPAILQRLLESHTLTRAVVIDRGVVERKTGLRYGPAGPRNHDLALWAWENSPTAFVGIESKANDGFGETMQQQIDKAKRLRVQPKKRNTNLDERVEWLAECLLGVSFLADDNQNVPRGQREQEARTKMLHLPYQLFAGVAGTLLEAKKARSEIAVFIVHQFRTSYTNDRDIRADAKRLHRFASLLIQSNSSPHDQLQLKVPLRCDNLVGPIYLKHRDYGEWTMPTEIPLLIGEIQTDRTLR